MATNNIPLEEEEEGEQRWAGITFLGDFSDTTEVLTPADLAILRHVEQRPADVPLPGEGSKVWETPPLRLPSPEKKMSPVCEFGEATKILDNLQRIQLNPQVPAFVQRNSAQQAMALLPNMDATLPPPVILPPPPPTVSKPLNAASAPFVPNVPVPLLTGVNTGPPQQQQQHHQAQTIHINHLTANVNYHVPHISTAAAIRDTSAAGSSNSTNSSIALSTMPLPFTVGGTYVHPFPQQHVQPPPVSSQQQHQQQPLQPPPQAQQLPHMNMFPADGYPAPLLVFPSDLPGYFPLYHLHGFQPTSLHQPPPQAQPMSVTAQPPLKVAPPHHQPPPVVSSSSNYDDSAGVGTTVTFGNTTPFVSVKGLDDESGSEEEEEEEIGQPPPLLPTPPVRMVSQPPPPLMAASGPREGPAPKPAPFTPVAAISHANGPAAAGFPPPLPLMSVPPPASQLPPVAGLFAQPAPFTQQQPVQAAPLESTAVTPLPEAAMQKQMETASARAVPLVPEQAAPNARPAYNSSSYGGPSSLKERPTEPFEASHNKQQTLEYYTDAQAVVLDNDRNSRPGPAVVGNNDQNKWLSPPRTRPLPDSSAAYSFNNSGNSTEAPPQQVRQQPLARKPSVAGQPEAGDQSSGRLTGGAGSVQSTVAPPPSAWQTPVSEPPPARARGEPQKPVDSGRTEPEKAAPPSAAAAEERPSSTTVQSAPAPPAPAAAPVASWANRLFSTPSDSSNSNKGDKPCARITPFSAADSGPARDQAPVSGSDEESQLRQLGQFLSGYSLNHAAPALLPRGLTNRSNWCFVNAILQALLACPPFFNLMKALPNISGLKIRKSLTPMTDALVEFVHEFSALENGGSTSGSLGRSGKKDKKLKKEEIRTGLGLEPSYVYKMLLNLASDTFKVVEGRQEDAEEFLTCLLNGISDEMAASLKAHLQAVEATTSQQDTVAAGQPDIQEEADDWQEVGAKGRSCVTRRVATDQETSSLPATPVQTMALGMCRSYIKSMSGESAATLQPFFTLQLHIQNEGVNTVNEALASSFDSESLDDYICTKTRQVVEATRIMSLEELPPVLILQMKRFVYDATTGGVQKLMKPVQFTVDLEIPKSVLSNEARAKLSLKQRQYKLFAVVYHNGREATKGHYVTDVFHTGFSTWLHCDDSTVQETGEQSVLSPSTTSTPYILFYRRWDTMVGTSSSTAAATSDRSPR